MVSAGAVLPAPAAAQSAGSGQASAGSGQVIELPDVQVVDTSPLHGTGIAADKVAGMVNTLTAQDFERLYSFSVTDALFQNVPGATTSDVQGNPFFQDFRYRGFAASPLQGTPQGLAVYQNGIRVNEAFGDTVNWDLIPTVAIDRADVFTNNPVFGLNALGGAVSIQMKNGFTYHGFEGSIQGGSFGQIGGSVQYGGEKDGVGLYVAADAVHDDGWRYQSPSDLVRFFGDLGWKGDKGEVHVTASAARNTLGVVGPTPVEMLNLDYNSVYTWPQSTTNEMSSLALNGRYDLTDTWQLQGNLYVRKFKQSHVDGNDADLESCSSRWNPTVGTGRICLEEDGFNGPASGGTVASNPQYAAFRGQMVLYNQFGQTVPYQTLADNQLYGVINRTWTDTTTYGGSVQAVSDDTLLGHTNHFVVGGSLDYSTINFQSSTELGITDTNTLGVAGTGTYLHNVPSSALPDAYQVYYQPVNLNATTTYYGLYASNAFDMTDRLTATLGARLNIARISMEDATGISPQLNGDYTFSRVNPMIGFTYKLTPDATAYAGYSESNRAPTPLELNCADPNRPCLLENSLVADPPLNQVVSHTYEAGLRGRGELLGGRWNWKLGIYRIDSDDDIIAVASTQTGYGYYTNVPNTRRQGFEAGVQYNNGPWTMYANYSYIDATFQFAGTLASPNNPSAVDGEVQVSPGDRIPGIPPQTLKVGLDYMVTPKWKVGGDVIAASSQYYVGDEANQNPQLPGYWIANLRTSYQVTANFQLFALVNNVFNAKYATYGTYFDASYLGLANAEMQTPGQPLSVYAGLKATF
ncbi:TonB-dependent receptor [Azorhizobium doebereinerae]|uniref:TonB-dependent receptor n=1 Tax=Azorhizobium doebereinerae TaxID=281091 RepID=UPI001FD9ECFB|nr:TonB-dependent receptor [Azorhizobium doebereinerae]